MSVKISVIIPNYHHADYLPQRIESVLSQTLEEIEIIILDDASPDHSVEVIHHYAAMDSRIRTMLNQENTGNTFVQWNRGVKAARGEYVWIAESDDWAEPDFLETLVARLEANPRAVLSYCQSHLTNSISQVTGSTLPLTHALDRHRWQSDFTLDGRELCRQYQIVRNTIPNASAVVFRREAYERIGGAAVDFAVCGDWLTWSRLAMLGQVEYSARALNYWRYHRRTVRSSRLFVGLEESARVMDEVARMSDPDKKTLALAQIHLVMAWQSLLRLFPLEGKKHLATYHLLKERDRHLWRHFVMAGIKLTLEKIQGQKK